MATSGYFFMATDTFPESLYLYGSGAFAEDVWHICGRTRVHVEGILEFEDQRIGKGFPHGGQVVGSAYEAMRKHPLPVLLAIHNPYADIHRIAATLEELGCPLVLTPLQFYSELRLRGVEAPSRYWLAGTTDVDPIAVGREPLEIAVLRSRLSDAQSTECLDELIAWRCSGSWRDSPNPRPMNEQYCSADIPLPRDGIVFVDVGAFTGDTVQNMAGRGFSFDRVLALEPDPGNYAQLVQTLRGSGVQSTAVPAAAGSVVGMASFSATAAGSSAITDVGSEMVPVVRLDDLLIHQAVDYVKMDVEGSELATLQGLADVIKSQTPALAVSAYHRPSDLLEIPDFLLRVNPRYSFFMRTYGQMSFDTVLYAIQLD